MTTENTLRRLIISQNAYCEEVLIYDREDNIDSNTIDIAVGYYEGILYLPFLIDNCFINVSRIRRFSD